ncbi:hypothetical protein BJ508DRAFT_311045 [Ascobolus immersus RN42]|uniref:Uncharacterized protein n=1 Tax=Ascobolus immersus RN42 TaxID=1160509 RepID=A0A3N4HXH1_ASCIM|nr:hypothetical protein BJ508DRAFT_311045 [Ascobolus immersus RN42]
MAGIEEMNKSTNRELRVSITLDRELGERYTSNDSMLTEGGLLAYGEGMTDFNPFISRGQTVGHTTAGEVYSLSFQISSSGLELLAIKSNNGWIQDWVDPNEENSDIIQWFLLCKHTFLLKLAWQYQQTVSEGKGKRYIKSCSWIATCVLRDGKATVISDSQTEEFEVVSSESSGPLKFDEQKSSSLPFHQSTSPVSKLFNKEELFES